MKEGHLRLEYLLESYNSKLLRFETERTLQMADYYRGLVNKRAMRSINIKYFYMCTMTVFTNHTLQNYFGVLFWGENIHFVHCLSLKKVSVFCFHVILS
jgi:hypothetical protein